MFFALVLNSHALCRIPALITFIYELHLQTFVTTDLFVMILKSLITLEVRLPEHFIDVEAFPSSCAHCVEEILFILYYVTQSLISRPHIIFQYLL